MQIRESVFALALLLSIEPAFGVELKVETLVEGSKYRAGAVTMTVREDQTPCGTNYIGYALLTHDTRDLTTTGFTGLQMELRALATQYETICPDLSDISFSEVETGWEKFGPRLSEGDNWQMLENRPSRAERNAVRDRAFKSLADFKNLPVDPDHALKDFGYYKANLIGETQNFSVFFALGTEFGNVSLVVLHKVNSDDEPLFDVRENGAQLRRSTGPVFMQALEGILKDFDGAILLDARLVHYIAGYHAPGVDRVLAMGPNAVEPPHVISGLPVYWENGEMFLSPYGVRLVYAPIFSRSDIIAARGPSGSLSVADPLALPDFGELPAEKPGAEYMARQALIRQAALNRGLIYKNDAYWSEFGSYETRRIFEAYADHLSIGGTPFGTILMRYLSVNAQKCRSTINDPVAFRLDEITTETNQWGASFSTTIEIYDIVVPGKFRAVLESRFGEKNNPDAWPSVMGMVSGFLQPGGLERLGKNLAETRETVRRSISDVDRIMAYGECGNLVQRQFEEMLYQLAGKKVPGEATKLSFSGAASISDRLYEAGCAPSLQGACVIDSEFGGVGNRTIRWCECVVDQVPQVMPEKVSEYVTRYAAFNRDVRIAKLRIGRGQDHPDNRLYSIQQYCAGQVD